MKTLWIAAIVCSLGSTGCIFGSSSGGSGSSTGADDDDGDSDDASVDDDDGGVSYAELAACRGEATDAEVIDTVAITGAYRDSLHEMVVCGGLAVSLCAAIVEGVIEAIQNASDDATPPAWSYDAGVYRTAGNGVEMEARFFYAQDFAVGQAGEQVQHNLFLVDSYLVDAKLVIDLFTGEAEIRYDEPGPLVELLGYGADPANPLPVTFADLADIQDRLRALELESVIVFDDERPTGTIRYHLATPRQSAGALLDGAGLRFDLQQADGERAALDQLLVVDSWNVEYNGYSALQGDVAFHVDGRHFPFAGTMRWEGKEFPERSLTCP